MLAVQRGVGEFIAVLRRVKDRELSTVRGSHESLDTYWLLYLEMA